MEEKLYEIAGEIRRILDNATNLETGEVADGAWEQLDALMERLEAKLDACAAYTKNQSAFATAARREAQRLMHRARVVENNIDSFKSYMRECLIGAGERKVETPRFKIYLRRRADDVAVKSIEDVPPEFVRNEPKPLMHQIKRSWKITGEMPQGCEAVSRRPILVIS